MGLYEAAKCLFSLQFRLLGWEVKGVENIPAEGPVIIVCNHLSLWDPVVAACAIPRNVAFMAKEELFSIPILRLIIPRLGAFPVKRGEGDMSAIRHSLSLLKDNKVLALFPEGTRSKTGEASKAQPGMVLLMEKSGAPVVPVKVVGTSRLLTQGRGKLKVVIGKPITRHKLSVPEGISNRRDWIAQKIMDIISSLQ